MIGTGGAETNITVRACETDDITCLGSDGDRSLTERLLTTGDDRGGGQEQISGRIGAELTQRLIGSYGICQGGKTSRVDGQIPRCRRLTVHLAGQRDSALIGAGQGGVGAENDRSGIALQACGGDRSSVDCGATGAEGLETCQGSGLANCFLELNRACGIDEEISGTIKGLSEGDRSLAEAGEGGASTEADLLTKLLITHCPDRTPVEFGCSTSVDVRCGQGGQGIAGSNCPREAADAIGDHMKGDGRLLADSIKSAAEVNCSSIETPERQIISKQLGLRFPIGLTCIRDDRVGSDCQRSEAVGGSKSGQGVIDTHIRRQEDLAVCLITARIQRQGNQLTRA